MNKLTKLKSQEWWEISRNPDPIQAGAEEMNEILAESRWWRKSIFENNKKYGWAHEYSEGKGYISQKDIKNFWKKWSDNSHFWHPQKKRWYALQSKENHE